MNLIDEAEIKKSNNDQNQAQKKLILIVVAIAILIVSAVFLYLYINNIKSKQLKIFVDGSKKTQINIFRKADDGTLLKGKDAKGNDTYYISIKDFAKYFNNYNLHTGLPNSYIEHDYSNCYIENPYEITVFTVGETKITKHETLNNNNIVELSISDKIYAEGDTIYAPSDAIEKAFNCKIYYTAAENKFQIYSLTYLVQTYGNQYPLSAVKPSINSSDPSYEEFQNQKAVSRGYLIIKDPSNNKLGVLNINDPKATKDFEKTNTLKDTSNLEIGLKYSTIRFIEENETFYVKTEDNKVGIINNDGRSIVNPIYLSIDTLDSSSGTYVAQSDTGRFGVIDSNQRNIIPFDFDQIGITDTYGDPNVTNKYLLLDYYIPVKNSEGYTFYSKQGARLIANQSFKGVGCVNNSSQTGSGSRGVVVIPELHSVIISYDEQITGDDGRPRTATFYGVVGDLYATDGNVSKMESIAGHFTQIYAREVSGKTTYMAVQEGTSVDVVEFINNYYSQIQQGGQTQEQANVVENQEGTEGEGQQEPTASQG